MICMIYMIYDKNSYPSGCTVLLNNPRTLFISRADPSRVFNTDGHKLIALGFHDRKVRFVDIETGRERPPVIWGHAGSVRCVALNEGCGYVLSGSYDTSIRWVCLLFYILAMCKVISGWVLTCDSVHS